MQHTSVFNLTSPSPSVSPYRGRVVASSVRRVVGSKGGWRLPFQKAISVDVVFGRRRRRPSVGGLCCRGKNTPSSLSLVLVLVFAYRGNET